MQLAAHDITIAVTMYRRIEYLPQALRSAVEQTIPVKVILYDDGCQDLPALEQILARWPGKIEYRRNPKTLGLFQNMNRCIQDCTTAWLSILHDDDALAPDFVETILAAAPQVPAARLFFGGTTYLTVDGKEFHRSDFDFDQPWRSMPLDAMAVKNWFAFPGQLMHAPTARQLGAFPEKSLYTGDWDLWFRLAAEGGAVQIHRHLGLHRTHLGADRGTTASAKTGRRTACVGMQVKKNFGYLRRRGSASRYDRAQWLQAYRPLYRDVLVYSWEMPRWLLRYNRSILLMAPHRGRASRMLNTASRVFGSSALRLAGLARNLAAKRGKTRPTF